MAGQNKVQFHEGYALDSNGVVSNVATNQASMDAARGALRGDGTETVYFAEVRAKRIVSDEALYVDGDSIRLADGVVFARNLVQTEQLISNSAQIADTIITPGHISTPNLSALSADLGHISAGSISVCDGGVTISNDSGVSGIYIGDNQIYSKVAGHKTLWWDGVYGVISTGSPGEARSTMDDDGFKVITASDAVAVWMTKSEGLGIRNTSGAAPTDPEQISFVSAADNIEGVIYYNHTAHHLMLAEQSGGAPNSWIVIDNTQVQVSSVTGAIIIDTTTGGTSIYLRTDVNGADRVWMYDGRMTAATHVSVPIVDYAVIATGTSKTGETGLSHDWVAGNHVGAPTSFSVSIIGSGAAAMNVTGATLSASAATVDWMTVDGSTIAASKNIHVVGYWL